MAEVTQTMVMVGQGLGALVFNSLADRYGRKPTHVMCTVGMLTVSVATALSPNYVFLLVCRVAIGALQQVRIIYFLLSKYQSDKGAVLSKEWRYRCSVEVSASD